MFLFLCNYLNFLAHKYMLYRKIKSFHIVSLKNKVQILLVLIKFPIFASQIEHLSD